jgi:hypothetical protein
VGPTFLWQWQMLNGVRMAPFRFCLPRDRIWCTRCSWCTNAQSQRGTSIARSTTDANIAKRPSRAGQSWMWIFVKIPPPSFSQATRTGSSHEQTTNRGSPRTEPLPRWMPRLGRRLSPSPPPDCARGPPRRHRHDEEDLGRRHNKQDLRFRPDGDLGFTPDGHRRDGAPPSDGHRRDGAPPSDGHRRGSSLFQPNDGHSVL